MNDTKLKPCPFCGGKSIEILRYCDGPTAYYFASCNDCFSSGGHGYMKEKAVENWNKRHAKRKSTALLPCRFCGSKYYAYWALPKGYTCIGCSKCGTQAEGAKTEIQARRNWNALMAKEGTENE